MPGASHTADVAEYVDSCLSQQIVSDFGVMVKRQFLCQVGDANIETFNTLLGQHIYKAAIRYERELADVLSAVYAHEPAPFGPISSQYAYPAFVNIMLSEPHTAAFSQPLNCKKPHIDWFMRRRIRLYADILTEEEQCEAFHHAFSAFLKCHSDLRQQFLRCRIHHQKTLSKHLSLDIDTLYFDHAMALFSTRRLHTHASTFEKAEQVQSQENLDLKKPLP